MFTLTTFHHCIAVLSFGASAPYYLSVCIFNDLYAIWNSMRMMKWWELTKHTWLLLQKSIDKTWQSKRRQQIEHNSNNWKENELRERERAGKAVTRHVLSIQNTCFPPLSALLHLGVCDHMCTIFTIFMMMIINLWSWQTDRFLTITLKLCVARFHFLAVATCAPAVRQRFYMRRKMIISLLRSYRCTMSSECIDLLMSINGKVCGFWWNICLSAL